MHEEKIEVDTEKPFKPFEKVLFFIVLFIHFGFLVEFLIKGFIGEKESEEKTTLVMTIFIIVLTIFWITFIMVYASRQLKETKKNYNKLFLKYELSLKNSRYKDGSKKLGKAFSIVHQLQHEFNSIDADGPVSETNVKGWKLQFEWVCVYIAEAFKEITGQGNISVCIKFLFRKKNGQQMITTFVRDRDHSDRIYNDLETYHNLEENTALAEIVHRVQDNIPNCGHYLSNNVPQEPNFYSTSFKFRHQKAFDPELTPEVREERWKLPYKSTIITLISPTIHNHFDKNHLQGFLCIDCDQKYVWDNDMLEIAKGVSEGLFNVIKTFNDITSNVIQVQQANSKKQNRK